MLFIAAVPQIIIEKMLIQNGRYKFWAIVLLVLFLDQVTKWCVIEHFSDGDVIKLFPFFDVVLVWNYGISFGIFNDIDQNQLILSTLSLVVAVFFFMWYNQSGDGRLLMPVSMVIGGAIGNVIDRLFYGAVIDFIDLHYNELHYPAFNIADMFIVCGALACILIDSVKQKKVI